MLEGVTFELVEPQFAGFDLSVPFVAVAVRQFEVFNVKAGLNAVIF